MSLFRIARLASLCGLGIVAFVPSGTAGEKIPVTTSSEEARALYVKARDLQERLRITDAHALYQQAAAKDPSFALAHLGLANTSPSAKAFFDATKKAVELGARASEGERLLICSLDAGAKGEVARQKDCLTKLIAAFPDDERAHNQLGIVHFGQQDYPAALAELQKTVAINPAFSGAYNQLGYVYRTLQKYAESEQAFKKYIELVPDDPNPYDSYAEFLMKRGRFEESIQNYEKALAVDKNFIASYVGIANNRIFMGQPAEARKATARLTAQARNDGEKRQALFWNAMSYVHEGATDQAVAEVQKMADIAQAGGDLAALSGDHNQIGDILLEAGRADEAAGRYAQQVATIDKADVPAQVKEATHRQALFDAARVALAKNDLASAKAKAAAYQTAVAAKKVPFELRQSHELNGRVALAEKNYTVAVAELQKANQQDPRVLYLTAVALRDKGDLAKSKEVGVLAADFNALSATYGFVRGKAKAMVSAPKKD